MRPCLPTALLAALAVAGCDSDSSPTAAPETHFYEFSLVDGSDAWTGDFADLPAEHESFDLVFDGERSLPQGLPIAAAYLAGSNHSDDLFMYLRRQVGDLSPGTTYRVAFEVQIATSVEAGLVGIGGAPGESVFIKAGVSAEEPVPVVATEAGRDMLRLSIDKGNQATGSRQAAVLGHIARDDGGSDGFDTKSVGGEEEVSYVTADDDGRVWIFAGTESGFEGRTEIYITRISATFTPQ